MLFNNEYCLLVGSSWSISEMQALKYRPVMDIVRPIRAREETTGHSVRRKWNWGVRGLLFVRPERNGVQPNCNFVQRKSKCSLVQD
jgi:hypothetical protein